jgi:uncharacterized Ntn-hydrolase superfamily protein
MISANTFSIVARCPQTGMLGVAVSTAVPGVGGLCCYARAGAGAVSTQAWLNPYLAIDALPLLAEGTPADKVLERVIAQDPYRAVRQLGIVDTAGGAAAWTGEDCVDWCGHREGAGYSVQGNMLKGEATLDEMASAFEHEGHVAFPERLLVALEAGQAAGGDKRGKQSAALLVVSKEEYPLVDLRVDDAAAPVHELRRVFEVARHQLLPFVAGLPTRDNPAGNLAEDFTDMLMQPPPERAGGGGGRP